MSQELEAFKRLAAIVGDHLNTLAPGVKSVLAGVARHDLQMVDAALQAYAKTPKDATPPTPEKTDGQP